MAAKLIQPSFGGGEYDPDLWGRQDLGRYGISGRLVRNFIVRSSGGMVTRPGTQFVAEVKDSSRQVRLLPFAVSELLAYIVELGHLYARFHYRGAPVLSGGVPVEVVTPWTEDQLDDVAFTQSADTMFLAHTAHATRLLKRTGASAFELSTFAPRQGPFRSLNSNEALKLAASARTGTVTVTSNFDLFTPAMVGGLIFMEPQALGSIKPWVQGERSNNGTTANALAVGVLRRSDGKVYQAKTVAAATAPNYTETGNVRPVHELGREWDGPGDKRKFDTIEYTVGVEWEYLHSGYGIVEITGYTDARTVTGTVKKTLPAEVVGGFGTPANTWTFSGNGSTKVFSVTGATSTSQSNYTVTVNGSPTQSDPNYTPPGGNTGSGGTGGPGSTYEP